jgi:hypothetical protein
VSDPAGRARLLGNLEAAMHLLLAIACRTVVDLPADSSTTALAEGGGSLETCIGSLDCPLPEPVSLERAYGYEVVYRGETQHHLAADLDGEAGDVAMAACDGSIVYVGDHRGYGSYRDYAAVGPVTLVACDDLSEPVTLLYGHCRGVAGDRVTRGDPVCSLSYYEGGTVGSDWSHLHFGANRAAWDPARLGVLVAGYAPDVAGWEGAWVDPLVWLDVPQVEPPAVADTGTAPASARWVAVYRYVDRDTGARCWGTGPTPPATCASFEYELEAWIGAADPLEGTFELVECGFATDFILVAAGSADAGELASEGYDCSTSLGRVWVPGAAPDDTPWAATCPVYRFRYDTPGGGAHLFTRGADDLTGMACEPPVPFEVATNFACFGGPPPGC